MVHEIGLSKLFLPLYCSDLASHPIGEINAEDVAEATDGGKRRSPDPNAPIYGELIVLG